MAIPARRWRGVLVLAVLPLAACSSGENDREGEAPTDSSVPIATTEATTTTEHRSSATTTEAQSPTGTEATSPMETVPAVTSVPAAGQTFDDPVPVGDSAPVGDGFRARVNGVSGDATAEIVAEDPLNTPPAAGNMYVLVDVTVTFEDPNRISDAGVLFLLASAEGAVRQEQTFQVVPEPQYLGDRVMSVDFEDSGRVPFEVPADADLSTYAVYGITYFAQDQDAGRYFSLVER